MTTIKQLNEIFEEEVLKAAQAGLPIPTEVYSMKPVLSNAKSFLGLCQYKNGRITAVKISKYLLEYKDTAQLRETIAHELCHTAAPTDGHGWRFHHYAYLLNRTYGYHIARTATKEETDEFQKVANYVAPAVQYVVKCTGCGQVINRSKMCKIVKYPQMYTCGICHKPFVRVS